MARLNLEDSLFTDKRYRNLVLLLGSDDHAIGALVNAWQTAQKYWVPDRKAIPLDVWKQLKLNDKLIEAGLAREVDDGNAIHVCGAEDQFGWIFERKESGRKGGLRSQANRLSKAQAEVELSLSKSNPLTLTLTPTLKKNIYKQENLSEPSLSECIESWGHTLTRYGINKSARMDEAQIARLIQIHGAEKTKLALLGAGFETKTERYDPAKYCRITRLLKPDIFDLCVNLGSQQKPSSREVFKADDVEL